MLSRLHLRVVLRYFNTQDDIVFNLWKCTVTEDVSARFGLESYFSAIAFSFEHAAH